MPRDYKHVSPRRAPAKKTSSPFVWAAVAVLLGVFVMGLFWLKMQPPANAPEWVGAEPERKPREVAKPVGPPKKIQPEKPETRFTFFKDLSQREVVVPDEKFELRASRDTDATSRFVVQIASLTKRADAERIQAEVALLGVESTISEASLDDGVRYRVSTTPVLGQSKANSLLSQLKKGGYKGMFVKISR
jgi:cell division protein FtsN